MAKYRPPQDIPVLGMDISQLNVRVPTDSSDENFIDVIPRILGINKKTKQNIGKLVEIDIQKKVGTKWAQHCKKIDRREKGISRFKGNQLKTGKQFLPIGAVLVTYSDIRVGTIAEISGEEISGYDSESRTIILHRLIIDEEECITLEQDEARLIRRKSDYKQIEEFADSAEVIIKALKVPLQRRPQVLIQQIWVRIQFVSVSFLGLFKADFKK